MAETDHPKYMCKQRYHREYITHQYSHHPKTKNTIVCQGGGSETLMREVEPHLVELICAMAQIRRCLTSTESISLANDLISGTEVEKRIIDWKKKKNGI